MKVPFSWLRDYVDVGKLSPEEVAAKLTMAGLEVVLIEKVGGDSIFDIEVTPNRPDCLSIVGVAREVAACLAAGPLACLQKRLKSPKIKSLKAETRKGPAIEIKDENICLRYTGRVINDVKIGPSPRWLIDRLEKMGLRSVNNLVDITNFCLFELGQPTHAFDYDKLKGRIIVRRARRDERIVTIDEKERTLDLDTLVIADEEKVVALGGIMGSRDTEVTSNTKNILFESAYFNPVSIRRTSRKLGLISESSYRFERSVDMGGIVKASERACSLILELCGGRAGPLVDVGKKEPKEIKIYLRPQRLKKILGLDISLSTIKKILSSLELEVRLSSKETMVVSIPSFRQDLKSEIDLIEEIIRIYGYDKLPTTMPTIVGHPKRMDLEREASNIARDVLTSLGADEVITYSLISKEDLNSIDLGDERTIVIKNPLSIEQEIMRPTLVPGILRAVSWNLNRGVKNIRVFELGKIYFEEGKHFREEEGLSIASSGELSFLDMKGMLETLFSRLGVSEVSFKAEGFPNFLSREAASIEIGKKRIGFLGKVKREILERFDIKVELLLCELSLKGLLPYVKLEKRLHELPRFPSVKRDISMVVGKDASHEKIVSVVKKAGGDLVADIELFDEYFGTQIPQDARGLSYSIEYRALDRTLTDEEVNNLHRAVCDALVQRLGAKIR